MRSGSGASEITLTAVLCDPSALYETQYPIYLGAGSAGSQHALLHRLGASDYSDADGP
jgi:hypothetical protein